jgi:receptor expression-enhancing protein 1/2/3/4
MTRDLSNSGTLIPPTVHGEERLNFITAQRERLSILLSALDKEANNLQAQSDTPRSMGKVNSMFLDGSSGSEEDAGLISRKSEGDFEKIEAESCAEDTEHIKRQVKRGNSSSGGSSWRPWSWGSKPEDADIDTHMAGTPTTEYPAGKSSGIDL